MHHCLWRVATAACLAVPPRAVQPRLMDEDPTAVFFRRQLMRLPDEPDTCLLQVRAALQSAAKAGKSALWVDLCVPELDFGSRGFDPDIMQKFAVAIAQELDAASGTAPNVLVHGSGCSDVIRAAMQGASFTEGRGAIPVIPLDDLNDNEEEAEIALGSLDGVERAAFIIGPFGDAPEHRLSRAFKASGKRVLVFNHRPISEASPGEGGVGGLMRRIVGRSPPPPMLPPLPDGFEVGFELVPVVVQQKVQDDGGTPREEGDGRPAPVTAQPREVPTKAVLLRRFPADWALLVNVDGTGYQEAASYEQRPSLMSITSEAASFASGPPEQPSPQAQRQPVLQEPVAARVVPAEPPSAPPPATLPDGVVCKSWREIDEATDGSAFEWYTAACLLRLREAKARKGAESRDDGTLWDADQAVGAMHLFAADEDGWRSRPVRLSAHALLLLDQTGAGERGQAQLSQVSVAALDSSRWVGPLLDAAESLARLHGEEQLSLPAPQDTSVWASVCEQRGWRDEGGRLVKRL